MNQSYTLTDTHTHIYYQADPSTLSEQIAECKELQIHRLFLPNVDIESISSVFQTVELFPQICFPMLGLHPCSVTENYKSDLNVIEKNIQERKIYAIGEIGLDLYWDKSTLSIQKEAFKIQCQWAKDLKLSINIHCRDAFDELFVLLEELQDGNLYGILHCFTGSYDQAQRAINLGFSLGIGGVVTFKNSGLDRVVSKLSLQDIVLETDAPYLAPAPFRGKENKSPYLHIIAQKVADIHQISIQEVAEITTQNSKNIYKT